MTSAKQADGDLTNSLIVLRAVAHHREELRMGPTVADQEWLASWTVNDGEDPLLAGITRRRSSRAEVAFNAGQITPAAMQALDALAAEGGWPSRNSLCVAALQRSLGV